MATAAIQERAFLIAYTSIIDGVLEEIAAVPGSSSRNITEHAVNYAVSAFANKVTMDLANNLNQQAHLVAELLVSPGAGRHRIPVDLDQQELLQVAASAVASAHSKGLPFVVSFLRSELQSNKRKLFTVSDIDNLLTLNPPNQDGTARNRRGVRSGFSFRSFFS